MNTRAMARLSSALGARGASMMGSLGYNIKEPTAQTLARYPSKIQFERLSHDIGMWRDAIREMELSFYPMRVKAMRMYNDIIESPYIKPVIERWRQMVLQRDFEMYQIKDGKRVVSRDLTQALSEQYWFQDYAEHILDAEPWGYSLISLGDIVNDSFPELSIVKRENIRPDGNDNYKGPILSSLVYSINGIEIKNDPLIDMCNHWIPTKSNNGTSSCGYGWLYNIGWLEIHLRHAAEWNMDYLELFGMPIKVGSTKKQGKDRDEFEAFIANGASNAWVLLDSGTEDKVEYITNQNGGTAWKSYENIEQRFTDKVAQLILGHSDAMKSSPGKLGGQQQANKDGYNENLVEVAMGSKQIASGNFLSRSVNEIGIPRFQKLAKYVGSKVLRDLFPEGFKFGQSNDKEENAVKRNRNSMMLIMSEIAANYNKAGYDMDAKQMSDDIGFTLTPATPETRQYQIRDTSTVTKTIRLDADGKEIKETEK